MKKLYGKLEKIQEEYEIKKSQMNERKQYIFDNISFTKRVVLREYVFVNTHLRLFQKNIVFSKIKDKYHVLHEANNSKFHYARFGDNANLLYSMYILIPKAEEEAVLVLFVRREGYKKNFSQYTNGVEGASAKCFPNLYMEHDVKLFLDVIDFSKPLNCVEQLDTYGKDWCRVDTNYSSYEKAMKKYIKENYLNSTFDFRIYPSDDYFKYIEKSEYQTGFNKMISELLRNEYSNLNSGETKSTMIDGFSVVYTVTKTDELLRANVSEESGRHLGYVYMEDSLIKINIKICFEGNCNLGIPAYENEVELYEGKEFKDKLGNYFNESFNIA